MWLIFHRHTWCHKGNPWMLLHAIFWGMNIRNMMWRQNNFSANNNQQRHFHPWKLFSVKGEIFSAISMTALLTDHQPSISTGLWAQKISVIHNIAQSVVSDLIFYMYPLSHKRRSDQGFWTFPLEVFKDHQSHQRYQEINWVHTIRPPFESNLCRQCSKQHTQLSYWRAFFNTDNSNITGMDS